jgi:hypothetical protein
LIPELGEIESWTPPPEVLGSGKFDTPWERMHLENASACEYPFAGSRVDGLEDPHVAISAPQTMTTAGRLGI